MGDNSIDDIIIGDISIGDNSISDSMEPWEEALVTNRIGP